VKEGRPSVLGLRISKTLGPRISALGLRLPSPPDLRPPPSTLHPPPSTAGAGAPQRRHRVPACWSSHPRLPPASGDDPGWAAEVAGADRV